MLIRTRDARVFAGAAAIAILHALDDAFFHREAGTGLGQHALAASLSVAIAVAAMVSFSRVRPGVRAALAVFLAIPAVVNGGQHALHIANGGPTASDLTGVLALASGAVLLVLGASIPWRHRAERPARRSRRWAVRALVLPLSAAALLVVVLPVAMAIVDTHKYREPIGAPPNASYQRVSFHASDGVRISGWYRPSDNGAAVIVLHGGGGDRTGARAHAQLLARHGYGVLLYDARGRGESEGAPSSWGWGWAKDAIGALDYVEVRTDVEHGRIGALGLSSGADTMLELAARRGDLSAVVTDGAALRTFEDARRLEGLRPESLSALVTFTAQRVFSGSPPPAPLADLVPKITAPLLLISAGTTAERDYNESYAKIAAGETEHWNLPHSSHTAAIRTDRVEYERRVVGFLDRALRR
jgi:hypothetical protein